MKSDQSLSIIEGPTVPWFEKKEECIACHRVFENIIKSIEANSNSNDINQVTEPMIYYKDTAMPLTQLNAEANQIARAIKKNFTRIINADGDTVIAIHLSHSPWLLSALLAIWKLRAAYVPLETKFPDQRVQYVLEETSPSLVIVDEETPDRYAGTPVVTIDKLKELSLNLSKANLVCGCWGWDISKPIHEVERTAAIIYTSGSTGLPKGVRLSHRSILNRLKWIWKILPYSETEQNFLFKKAITFVDAITEIWAPLLSGKSLVVIENSEVTDAKTFMNICVKYQIERFIMSPALLRNLLQSIKTNHDISKGPVLPHLKICVSSADVLRYDVATNFFECFQEQVKLVNIYGSTEVNGDVLYHEVADVDNLTPASYVPSGIPLDNTIIYILDEDKQPVEIGEIGETYASGLMLASGYVKGNDPEKFLDNPFVQDNPIHAKLCRIGDLARTDNGIVFYEGRTDNQIKVLGFRVSMSEVDHAISEIEGVKDFATLCYKHREPEQALLAFVTGDDPELRWTTQKHLEETLPPYMVPVVVVVESIPLLSSNKIDRQKLFKHYESECKRGSYNSGRNPFVKLPL